MVSLATNHARHPNRDRPRSASAAEPLLGICGALIALFGIILASMSALSTLDSGPFFLFAGVGLILSGALLAKRHVAGAWTYMAVFAATLAWTLVDAGAGGSSVAYRVIGPIIMLVALALLMPELRRWSPARTVAVLSGLVLATVLTGSVYGVSNDPAAASISPNSHIPSVAN